MKNDANYKANRERYRRLADDARRFWGWSMQEFNAKCKALAEYFQRRGEAVSQSWVSAACEVISEEQLYEAECGEW